MIDIAIAKAVLVVLVPSVTESVLNPHIACMRYVLVTAVALVEDGRAFVCTAQLLRVEADLFAATLSTPLVDHGVCLHVFLVHHLHLRPLGTQRRGEGRRLGAGNDRLGGSVCISGQSCANLCTRAGGLPLQDAPHTWQVRIAFCLPALPSSRLPQSVQKTRDPMAAMV